MPYDNAASAPICSWYPLDTTHKVFKNISFIRSADSKYMTYLVKFEGQYNVLISNASIKTLASDMNGDVAIKIANSAKVRFRESGFPRLRLQGVGARWQELHRQRGIL